MLSPYLPEHEIPKSTIIVNTAISTIVVYLILGDVLLILTLWSLGVFVFLGLIALSWFSVSLDEGLNPWIDETEMDWASIFTTKHYNTWLYINDAGLWLTLNTFFFLPLSLSLVTYLVDPLTGLGLTIGSLILSSGILVGIHLVFTKREVASARAAVTTQNNLNKLQKNSQTSTTAI